MTLSQALSNLDQPSLNSFSTALHGATSDPDIINLITSHTAPSVVPTLAVAMNRVSYTASDSYPPYEHRHEDSAQHHQAHQPPISPRLHSLPDNVLSPLGLLAEASLGSDGGKKQHPGHGVYGPKGIHRPSPLSLGEAGRQGVPARTGSAVSTGSYRVATSDVRGGQGEEDGAGDRGVAAHNYFRPGELDDKLPHPQLTCNSSVDAIRYRRGGRTGELKRMDNSDHASGT